MYRVSHIPCRISIYQFTADWESRIMGHPVIYLVLERLAGNPGARALPGLPSWLARPARWPASSALPPHPRPFFNLKQTNASCRNRKMYFFATSLSLSLASTGLLLVVQPIGLTLCTLRSLAGMIGSPTCRGGLIAVIGGKNSWTTLLDRFSSKTVALHLCGHSKAIQGCQDNIILRRNTILSNNLYIINAYLTVSSSIPSQMLLKIVRNKATSIASQSSQEGWEGLKIKTILLLKNDL